MQQVLIWLAVGLLVVIIFIPYVVKFRRSQRVMVQRRQQARTMGIDRPHAQFPLIDRSRCIGCGSCVAACPEGDVLGVVWGVAEVINGARCVGHGHCETACPVGAIKIGLGDIRTRPDIPILSASGETSVPGLFVAGELGGLSLIRNAVAQGRAAVDEIASRIAAPSSNDIYDVVIVGAGPAGLSAALTAVQHGLKYLVLEENSVGGTLLQYPRRKLVMTQPVELPLYGWLKETEYSKEDLVETWRKICDQFGICVLPGRRVESVRPTDSHFEVVSGTSVHRARFVVLAMGRRGTPRKLGVSGEDLPKVMYQLVDAQSYSDLSLLVVGGGDSAVEAAVGLARQRGNNVTISYRKSAFARVKKKNEEAALKLIKEGRLTALFDSEVVEILGGNARIRTKMGETVIPNDYVIVQIGGEPPFEMLKRMGIAFGGEDKHEG